MSEQLVVTIVHNAVIELPAHCKAARSVFVYYEKGKVLFRICIQERCHSKCLADGWAGGQGQTSQTNCFRLVFKSKDKLDIFEIKPKVVNKE